MLFLFKGMNEIATPEKKNSAKETPLMLQYNHIKSKYPDAILLFRVGDFYETFDTDAVTTARILGIILTKRSVGAAATMDLAGFPYHALDTYLPKLVKAGFRVAICEQLEDPKSTKTIVKRGVTELITPGVTDNLKLLDNKSNNYLCALHFSDAEIGIAFADISTGEFLTAQGNADYAEKLLQSFSPSEIIFSKKYKNKFIDLFGEKFYTYPIEDWIFQLDFAHEQLLRRFEVSTLKGFGIDEMTSAVIACGSVIKYLSDTEHPNLQHFTHISRIDENEFVWIDRFTLRNLEILQTIHSNGKSLLQTIDHTHTPMGARLLRRWITMPLKEIAAIQRRHDIVDFFIKNNKIADAIIHLLKPCGDLERLIARVPLGRITPREVVQLKRALHATEKIKDVLSKTDFSLLTNSSAQLNPCNYLQEKIQNEIVEEAPVMIQKGGAIRNGVSDELDDLRKIATSGKDYLITIQQREIQRTGISSLKIAFNSVFGFYLEVTNAHKNKVPADWIRKQTLVNAERYVTPELKEYEEKITGAEEKILALEQKLFEELVFGLREFVSVIQSNANVLAQLDCLLSFTFVSEKNNYCKPEISDDDVIDIKNGRHPVIELLLAAGENFVPNDIYVDTKEQQLLIITGPNMAGKSALIRQVALIVLLAQIGSYVPAESAHIGIVDKIFTRVGASDNLSAGESTFMVEMTETASILNNISEKSLLILDEIGRGTSTYDGISIAWSIAEFLHDNPNAHPRTLFATHYHELNELEDKFPRIKNYNVSVKETGNNVIFLRKLKRGGSEHSFGIHVARMAGMPSEVLHRANEIMVKLEKKTIARETRALKDLQRPQQFQLDIFDANNKDWMQVKDLIEKIDVNALTPMEALIKLNEIKKLLSENK
jgi:DNA mismatch repair protein MutS